MTSQTTCSMHGTSMEIYHARQLKTIHLTLRVLHLHGNGDSTSLDPWSEALSSSFDLLPNLQTDSPLLDLVPDSCTTESLMPWEETIPSSNAVPITPGNSYRPTPDLTECSTPTCLSITDGFHDPPVRNSGSFDTENQRWHGTSIPESFPSGL